MIGYQPYNNTVCLKTCCVCNSCVCVTHKQNFKKNQNSNLNEFVKIAEKKFPSLVIAAFSSAEV